MLNKKETQSLKQQLCKKATELIPLRVVSILMKKGWAIPRFRLLYSSIISDLIYLKTWNQTKLLQFYIFLLGSQYIVGLSE